jgi:putative transposase
MPNYRRNYVPGGTYAFTIVTEKRRKLFNTPQKLDRLLSIVRHVQRSNPFELLAWCLLPDHVHLLIKLPEGDDKFPIRMREIKRLTTLWMRKEMPEFDEPVWQDKFWEHTVRDEPDRLIQFDYIHYNPVKHGYTDSFDGWKWSSFRDYYDEEEINTLRLDPERFKKYRPGFGE